MPQKPVKVNHQEFVELLDAFKQRCRENGGRFTIDMSRLEFRTLLDHGKWFKDFLQQKNDAARATKSPGRKRMPAKAIKPESLARRQKREEAKNAK